jgi:hypothetical protein
LPDPHTPEQQRLVVGEQGSLSCRQTPEEQVAPGVPAFGQMRPQHFASELHASPS